MSFDQLLQQVERRLADFMDSRQADIVLSEESLAEAAELWQVAQPSDPEHPTPEESLRLGAAHYGLGWLHYLRGAALPSGAGRLPEVARSVTYFAPLAGHPDVNLPEPLQARLGASADADLQAGLAMELLEHAQTTTDQALLDAAIWLLTASLEASSDHPGRAELLSSLATAYLTRFARGGVPADLDKAIVTAEQAVAVTSDDHPGRAGLLSNLGGAYQARFERGGAFADLDKAILASEQAVAVTPHPDRAGPLSNLGVAYLMRFYRGGQLADLDKAIVIVEQAVDATPDDHPNRPMLLSNLGGAYQARFERGGESADLDKAIVASEQAMDATPDDHPNRAVYSSNVGLAYLMRFERGGGSADLGKAIAASEQAADATPDDHPNRALYLSNVGFAYRMRFDHGGEPADLDKAIASVEQAVDAIAHDHPNRAMLLSTAGLAYMVRYERGGESADLDKAIVASEQAVDATPDDHPNRAAYLSNVGFAYRMRFDRDKESSDLDKAIASVERAVAATPDDHPNRAVMLSSLGFTYQARLDVNGQGIDREALRAFAGQIAAAETGPPVHRVRAGWVGGSLANAMGEHDVAVGLLDAAVGLLPTVGPQEAGWADQEYGLGRHLGLVGEAVAAHCAINDPVGAVEAAELGRGILLATQLDSRSDLTDLDDAEPELAAEFRRVRDQLNVAPVTDAPSDQPGIDPGGGIEHRRRLWAEHDQLLTRIREQAGFARFLLPPRLADLRPTIAGGAAILLNAGPQRGDAVIITGEADPVHVPLPDAAVTKVEPQALALAEATRDNTPEGIQRRQRVVREILGWLWDRVVEPVLNALPPTGEGESAPRRVWWMPTGPFGLFPLHAAGRSGQPGALDAVVSSYTATLRTLAHARARPEATASGQLTVALNHTAGLPDLPGMVTEAENPRAEHSGTRLLLDDDATATGVLDALPEVGWAHFACPAGTDFAAPSQAGLVLHDALLALPRISQLHLGHAELAYLSACSTAYGGQLLADESLHLASAFQLAGFRHVIAGLWPLNDDIAAAAAAAFYQRLPATPTAEQAATALNHVTRDLRAENPDHPDLWAGLVHSGP